MQTLKAAHSIIKHQSAHDDKDNKSVLTRQDVFYNNVLRGARATFPLHTHRKATAAVRHICHHL